MGEETEPVTICLFCSRYKVKGMSPRELPCDWHSQVPVMGPGFGFFSLANAKLPRHKMVRVIAIETRFRFMPLLLFGMSSGCKIYHQPCTSWRPATHSTTRAAARPAETSLPRSRAAPAVGLL